MLHSFALMIRGDLFPSPIPVAKKPTLSIEGQIVLHIITKYQIFCRGFLTLENWTNDKKGDRRALYGKEAYLNIFECKNKSWEEGFSIFAKLRNGRPFFQFSKSLSIRVE